MTWPRFLIIFIFSLYGYAAASTDYLWPLSAKEDPYRVDVIASGRHTFIRVHPGPGEDPLNYREYGFAEKGWYLEGRQGVTGAVRALFWPTDSVVEVKRVSLSDHARVGEKGVRIWRFSLSRTGRDAMIDFLESWMDRNALLEVHPKARYYSGRHAYHLFRGCHQYTAGALRAGGLPLQSWWAFSRPLIAVQLDRVERL